MSWRIKRKGLALSWRREDRGGLLVSFGVYEVAAVGIRYDRSKTTPRFPRNVRS